jgi:hypothetical protein
MSNALRTLAVAAVMAGTFPMVAQASVTAPCTVSSCLDMSFAPGGKFTAGPLDQSLLPAGVTIANAQLFGGNPADLPLVNLVDVNGVPAVSGKAIVITFTTPGQYKLNALTLDYTAQFDINVIVHTTLNPTGVEANLPTNPNGGWTDDWVLQRTNGDALVSEANDWITSIEFIPDTANGNSVDFIGLNGLNFTQVVIGGNGGTVPEPASYGLAALALLAAGAASRRRASR